MSALCKFFLAAGAVFLMGSPCLGQSESVPLGGNLNGYDWLVLNESVQKELKLTDEELVKAKEIIHEVRRKHRAEMEALRDAAPDSRGKKMLALFQANGAEVLSRLEGLLKPEQIQRLKQIKVQRAGFAAFTDKEIEKALKLSDDQKTRIKALEEELTEQGKRALEGDTRSNFEEALRKLAAARRDALKKAVELLSAGQKKTWKDLTGEPFEVKFAGPSTRLPGGTNGTAKPGDKK